VAQELGNNQWLFMGPVIIVLGLAVCIWLTVFAARRQRRYSTHGTATRHGPVTRGTARGRRGGRGDETPHRDPD
jgi:hypothetical protein